MSLIRNLDIPLHFFPSSFNSAKKMLAFRQLVSELKPEVIHSYSFYTNIAAWWAALGRRIVAVGGMRSNFINDKRSCGSLLGSLCARWPQQQIFNNFAAVEAMRNSGDLFAPQQIVVVRNRLDLEQFPGTPLPDDGQTCIVGVGSLLPYKRWDRLLKAAAILKERQYEFLIEIAGDGPLRRSLERQAQDLSVSDRVKFVGYVNDVSAYLSRATFLAHTSDLEGFPNVVMEAMASRRAVVAMNVGDISSLIEEGKTGFIVPQGDDVHLVQRLATLINNRRLCHEMGEEGRKKAEREFGLDNLVQESILAYQALGWQCTGSGRTSLSPNCGAKTKAHKVVSTRPSFE